MEFFIEKGKQAHDQCSTLVLPALSIGNVGQLAVDLLVSSTNAERVGYLDNPFVRPCVGNDAYPAVPGGVLSLSLEGKDVRLRYDLADFVAASGKKHVIVLSGLDFGKWKNIDMASGSQIRYLSTTNNDGTVDYCELLGWKRLQEFDPTQSQWKYLKSLAEANLVLEDSLLSGDELEEAEYYTTLPFAALFTYLKAKGLKVTCLLRYCLEGDNIPDAFHLVATSKLLGLKPSDFLGNEGGKWVIPFSWQSVYGPPPDTSIF